MADVAWAMNAGPLRGALLNDMQEVAEQCRAEIKKLSFKEHQSIDEWRRLSHLWDSYGDVCNFLKAGN